MLRALFGVVAAMLALPAILAAQAPKPSNAGAARGRATQFQGEVVRPAADAARTVGDVGHNQADGNKAEDHKDAQEGPDVDEGPNSHEGSDVDEGPDVNEGPDVEEGPNDAAQAQGEGDQQDGESDTPPAAGQRSRVGRHKP